MLKLVENTEWTAMDRVTWHLEAIEAVRKQLTNASAAGELIEVRYARERLMTLEASLVNETHNLIKKAA